MYFKIDYGSPFYLCYLTFTALCVTVLDLLFRGKSHAAKRTVLIALALINVGQHLLKCFVWLHLRGTGFGIENTAYNVCSFLILSAPFVLLSNNNLLRQFLCYVGTIGPALALLFPTWFLGANPTWDFVRFYVCHALLFVTSLLPALWGMVRFRFKDFWKFGFLFLTMLVLVFCNNVLFFFLFEGTEGLQKKLFSHNPLWLMRPPTESPLADFFIALTPSAFCRNGVYLPVLWYALPVYAGVSLIALLLGLLLRKRRFSA